MANYHNFKSFLLGVVLLSLTGCATQYKTVPLRVQSDPLGAYVLFQVQADAKDERSYDWIYLGTTPLDTRRTVTETDLENADAFVVRVMKEGYLDQQKSWTGEQMVNEARSKGVVYWKPRMVPATKQD